MKRVQLSSDLSFSRIVHGYWRLAEWNYSNTQCLSLIENLLDKGITTFDHADIYGDYSCETLFGEALRLSPSLRQKMELVTKCGIKLKSSKFPQRRTKHYDYGTMHIVQSAENSLANLKTDYIDLLLLHRPSPFFDPHEVCAAFDQLHQQGKVRHFGVSNFTPAQVEMLQAHWGQPLVTNQLEISTYCLDSFQDGSIELCLKLGLKPMAWSPLAGGNLFNPIDDKGQRLVTTMNRICQELECDLDQLAYAWILAHPADIIPVVGSGKLDRILQAVKALELKLNLEQWFEIFEASWGSELP